MGDLEEEFKAKMKAYGLNFDWFEHPQLLLSKIDTKIDAITNLAEAKAFLRLLIRYQAVALWMLIQTEVQAR